MRHDTTTPDTRLADDPMAYNPATVATLVHLMLGGLASQASGRDSARARPLFRPGAAAAPGLPDDVAALVDSLEDGSTSLVLCQPQSERAARADRAGRRVRRASLPPGRDPVWRGERRGPPVSGDPSSGRRRPANPQDQKVCVGANPGAALGPRMKVVPGDKADHCPRGLTRWPVGSHDETDPSSDGPPPAPEWRNWQTRQLEGLVRIFAGAGSSPVSGTTWHLRRWPTPAQIARVAAAVKIKDSEVRCFPAAFAGRDADFRRSVRWTDHEINEKTRKGEQRPMRRTDSNASIRRFFRPFRRFRGCMILCETRFRRRIDSLPDRPVPLLATADRAGLAPPVDLLRAGRAALAVLRLTIQDRQTPFETGWDRRRGQGGARGVAVDGGVNVGAIL